MNTEKNEQRLDWFFRALIVAFLMLWVIYPPHQTETQMRVGQVSGTRL